MATEDIRSNGLKSFTMHSSDERSQPIFNALAEERDARPAFMAVAAPITSVDPETAARGYLMQALDSQSAPSFVAPDADDAQTQFKVIGTETVPLTGTRMVKFRQAYHDIPVYGSLVTVEIDNDNSLVSINSALGEPQSLPVIAKISAQQAAKAVTEKPPFKKDLTGIAPRLNYYYEASRSKWRLVFIFEDVPAVLPREEKEKPQKVAPRYFDYVVDAVTGRVIAELPRTPSMASEVKDAVDARQENRQIRVEVSGATSILKDTVYNIETFDFGLNDPDINDRALPGNQVPEPWSAAAVSAHANASAVAAFLRDVVKRNNIDGRGGPMNSSVNCVVRRESEDGEVWMNAYWNGTQMVYGQVRQANQQLLTLAAALDIVGHEMFHGITDNTSRLEYSGQSGALNESYSDIFGTIIANHGKPDPRDGWVWLLGEGFAHNGGAFRDVSNPPACGQPDHMRHFRNLPNTRNGDWGGVHTNSGIHNKAAYLILVSADEQGLVFSPEEVAAIFYVAVTQLLSRTSQFSDSRRGAVAATRSLFRSEPPAQIQRRISAVEAAFETVGISDPGT